MWNEIECCWWHLIVGGILIIIILQRGNTIGTIRSNEKFHRKWIDFFFKLWQPKSERNGKSAWRIDNKLNGNYLEIESQALIAFERFLSIHFQESNPNVAATFYWLPLRRQVRIEGVVSKISRKESEEYFHQRPRASQVCKWKKKKIIKIFVNYEFISQIGALTSPQSQPIPSREYLDEIENGIKQQVGTDGVVPLPNW